MSLANFGLCIIMSIKSRVEPAHIKRIIQPLPQTVEGPNSLSCNY